MSEFTAPLDAALQALVSQLGPAQRARLARRLAIALRQSQQARIAEQKNPDGSPYEPRKPQPRAKQGRLRRRMFERIRARYIKTSATAAAATVGIGGRAARIARVHQFGLEDRVNPAGLRVRYPVRQILGFTEEDERSIADLVLEHLTSG